MKIVFASVLITLMVSASVLADVPRPETPKSKGSIDTTLSIDLDREAKEARLIIPRSQLKQLRAELDALDAGDDTASTGGVSRIQTIVGGLFLSLAFVFAGFAFFRSARVGANVSRAAAAAAIVFAGGAFAAVAFGNAGPPAEARSITGKMFTQAVHLYGFGSGKIKLEVSDDVRYPTLIVPNPPDASKKTEE